MKYTQLGNSGLTVSRMALGAMTFGQYSFATFHANVDQATADRMVGLALDAGVNLFDTAEGYGDGASERVLGAALRRAGARDRAVIATKVSTYSPDPHNPDSVRMSYRHVVGNAEQALKRLGTDWIDVYQLHRPDFVTPARRRCARSTTWSPAASCATWAGRISPLLTYPWVVSPAWEGWAEVAE
jgi:aryl-alcohol dehydrogenase-like predicted oxidoreductase